MINPPSADQTNVPNTVVPIGLITDRPVMAKRCDIAVMNVLVIEYCDL